MDEDKRHKKGFNDGYLLQQEEPEIANSLSHVKSDDIYWEALRMGREQYLLDMKERFKSYANDNVPQHSKDKDKGMSRER